MVISERQAGVAKEGEVRRPPEAREASVCRLTQGRHSAPGMFAATQLPARPEAIWINPPKIEPTERALLW